MNYINKEKCAHYTVIFPVNNSFTDWNSLNVLQEEQKLLEVDRPQ